MTSVNTLLTVRRGDTRPRLRATLRDDEGKLIDLTDATVTLWFADGNRVRLFIGTPDTMGDPTLAKVEYAWAGTPGVGNGGDTDRTPADYLVYFVIDLPDGSQLTTPNGDEITVRITKPFTT